MFYLWIRYLQIERVSHTILYRKPYRSSTQTRSKTNQTLPQLSSLSFLSLVVSVVKLRAVIDCFYFIIICFDSVRIPLFSFSCRYTFSKFGGGGPISGIKQLNKFPSWNKVYKITINVIIISIVIIGFTIDILICIMFTIIVYKIFMSTMTISFSLRYCIVQLLSVFICISLPLSCLFIIYLSRIKPSKSCTLLTYSVNRKTNLKKINKIRNHE